MCTLKCLYCIFTSTIALAFILLFQKSVTIGHSPFVHNRLLPTIRVFVHCSDTGNVFQVF
jgi:hypothetical protein